MYSYSRAGHEGIRGVEVQLKVLLSSAAACPGSFKTGKQPFLDF